MKVCIVGASGHYRYALEGLDSDSQILGFAPGSPNEELGKLRAALAAANLRANEYADWRSMLDRLQPELVVVNPQFADHALISLACIARGIHVLSEKPLATTWEDLAALRSALATKPVHFAGLFGIRYKPAFLAAHAAVVAGRIGAVRLMQAQKSYKLGERPAFFSERARFGGLIPWVGSHAIDWLHWFSGAAFQSVTAQHSRLANRGNGALEVSAQCLFSLAHEITAQVSIDYLRPANAASHDDDRLRVVGTRGVVEVRDGHATLINDEHPGTQLLALPQAGSIFAEFLQELRGEGTCMVSAEDSLLVTEACLLARQSADEGQTLFFEQTLNRYSSGAVAKA